MMCFRDMTFCSDKCGNKGCSRQFNEEQKKAALHWWGSPSYPVAFSSFKDNCKEYKEGIETTTEI